jgi:IS30 family transposase
VERKSGYAVLAKVENKTADLVSTAIIKRLMPISERVQTLTYDNGKEFANHASIDKALGSTTYFADPYSMAAGIERKPERAHSAIHSQISSALNRDR